MNSVRHNSQTAPIKHYFDDLLWQKKYIKIIEKKKRNFSLNKKSLKKSIED